MKVSKGSFLRRVKRLVGLTKVEIKFVTADFVQERKKGKDVEMSLNPKARQKFSVMMWGSAEAEWTFWTVVSWSTFSEQQRIKQLLFWDELALIGLRMWRSYRDTEAQGQLKLSTEAQGHFSSQEFFFLYFLSMLRRTDGQSQGDAVTCSLLAKGRAAASMPDITSLRQS